MKLFLSFIFVLSLTNSAAQTKFIPSFNCEESLHIRYLDSLSSVSIQKIFYFEFLYGFDDSLEIYLNEVLLSKGYYKTNESVGKVIKSLTFQNKRPNSPQYLRIKSLGKNRCVEFVIDQRFKIINIDFGKNSWGVSYSNNFVTYE